MQQNVRLRGDADAARIDRDDLHAALSGADNVVRQDQRRGAWIVSPKQKSVAVRDVGRGNFDAEGVGETGILVPIANVGCRGPVGTAKAV